MKGKSIRADSIINIGDFFIKCHTSNLNLNSNYV